MKRFKTLLLSLLIVVISSCTKTIIDVPDPKAYGTLEDEIDNSLLRATMLPYGKYTIPVVYLKNNTFLTENVEVLVSDTTGHLGYESSRGATFNKKYAMLIKNDAKNTDSNRDSAKKKKSKPRIGDYKVVTSSNALGDTLYSVWQYAEPMVLGEPWKSWFPMDVKGYRINDPDFGQIRKYYHDKDSAILFIENEIGEYELRKKKALSKIDEEVFKIPR